jgi:hypothetical protein
MTVNSNEKLVNAGHYHMQRSGHFEAVVLALGYHLSMT